MLNLLAIKHFQKLFLGHGLQCKNCPIPVLCIMKFQADQEAPEASSKILIQREVFKQIMSAVEDNYDKQRYLFLDGPGGMGNTYLYNTLMSYIQRKKKIVLPFATSDIATDLLKKRTSSSWWF